MSDKKLLTRRTFLALSGAAVAAGTATFSVPAQARTFYDPRFRKLNFFNTHTNETLGASYWHDGQYDRKALRNFAYILRDHRSGDEAHIDPRLFDVLHHLQARLRNFDTIEIISGYRSAASNRKLARRSHGVARNSYHVKGQAIDIRIASVPTGHIHRAALSLQAGGVGYYEDSDFVHVDTGPVRSW
jgi:uncharacterized protein YcbK (DUF882 family)